MSVSQSDPRVQRDQIDEAIALAERELAAAGLQDEAIVTTGSERKGTALVMQSRFQPISSAVIDCLRASTRVEIQTQETQTLHVIPSRQATLEEH